MKIPRRGFTIVELLVVIAIIGRQKKRGQVSFSGPERVPCCLSQRKRPAPFF